MRKFLPKHPSTETVLEFDLSPELPDGVTLTGTPTVTISVYAGTDASPSAVLRGGNYIDSTGTKVLVPVLGGLTGVDYLITAQCGTTDVNHRPALPAVLPVRSKF